MRYLARTVSSSRSFTHLSMAIPYTGPAITCPDKIFEVSSRSRLIQNPEHFFNHSLRFAHKSSLVWPGSADVDVKSLGQAVLSFHYPPHIGVPDRSPTLAEGFSELSSESMESCHESTVAVMSPSEPRFSSFLSWPWNARSRELIVQSSI